MKPMTDIVEHPAYQPTTAKGWVEHMRHKAAHNIASVCESKGLPESEEEVKKMVAYAIKHGDCHERAEVLYEAAEFAWADMTLKMMERFPDFGK